MILQKVVQVVRYKTMVDGSVRLELDLGELTGDKVADLHNLKALGEVSLILTTPEILEEQIKNQQDDE